MAAKDKAGYTDLRLNNAYSFSDKARREIGAGERDREIKSGEGTSRHVLCITWAIVCFGA